MFREIFLDAPNLGEIEKLYLNKAVDSGFISSVGPSVAEFEKRCASYLRTQRAVSTSSGTAALHMALYELGVGKGDEVIVPSLTFIATVNPVVYVGATPVFVDADMETWNMDPEAVEDAVTAKTKAIIPVHLFGNPCDMNELNRIAHRHGLYVIEDAAESLGARYDGQFTGSLGDLGCFSFNGNKTITTGGGGLVAGNNTTRLDHIKYLVNQARDNNKEKIYHSEVGFNYRMNNIQASLGLAQFDRLEEFLAKKRTFNNIYRKEFRGLDSVSFQKEHELAESSYWFTCIRTFNGAERRGLQNRLAERGIPARRIFTPVHELPPYRECRFAGKGNADSIYETGVCLPCSTLNEPEDIKYVCRVVKEFYSGRNCA